MTNTIKKIFNPDLNRYTLPLMIIAAIILYAHYHYRYQVVMDQTYGKNRQTPERIELQKKQAYLREFDFGDTSANDISLIGPLHVKDINNKIYFANQVIPEADPETFTYFSAPGLSDRNVLSKDKNHVYVENQVVKNADPDTFIYLGQKRVAFFQVNTQIQSTGQEYLDLYYAIDKNHVFIDYEIVEGADPNSFQILDSYYDRDKDSIFYNGKKLTNSDADSFIFYPLSHYTYTRHDSFLPGYAIDKNQAYYNFEPINNVDINSFKLLKGYYAKDKNHVYFQGVIEPNMDPETFEYINQPLLKHDSTLPIAIKLADLLANNTSKEFYIYHDDYKRPNAYKYGYFRDKNNCYSYLNTHIIINQTWDCQLNNRDIEKVQNIDKEIDQ